MNQLTKMFTVLALSLVGAVGCKKERSVEISLVTSPRDGQSVQDDRVELQAGQAMAIRVVSKKKDKLKSRWKIEARSEDSTTVSVAETTEKDEKKVPGRVFVVSGLSPGEGQLRFKLKGKFDVFVDAVVMERPDWEPTVEPTEMGGAGVE